MKATIPIAATITPKATPPITPPTIAPIFTLLWCCCEDSVADGAAGAELAVEPAVVCLERVLCVEVDFDEVEDVECDLVT
jgi:hypothetical protein